MQAAEALGGGATANAASSASIVQVPPEQAELVYPFSSAALSDGVGAGSSRIIRASAVPCVVLS